jgi:multidrug efflux pump subunit AcrA (membrane-fusion protein)
VSVVSPQRKSLRYVVEQPGIVEAYEETKRFARVPGYVRLPYDRDGRILSDKGRKVSGPKYDASGKEIKPGDVLAELEVPELEEETNQKRARVRQTEAEEVQAVKALASATANIAVAEAGVTEAQALRDRWQSESQRMAGLLKKRLVELQARVETQYQFRAAEGRLASAKAAVEKARADRDKADADVKAAKARVDVAKAEARQLEAMLGYAKVRAPYDGIVTELKVRSGDYVQPGGKGDWLFMVARLDPVRIVVAVPEADAEVVREKLPAKLSIEAARSTPFEGTVARTSWALAPGARTLRAEIDLPNKDGLLRPGMFVHARILCRARESWTLPATAVVKQGDVTVCFLIAGGKAVRAPVRVGRSDGQFTEVLKVQKPGSGSWVEWTGQEEVAGRAVGLRDGQTAQRGGS